jgi:MFS family permease
MLIGARLVQGSFGALLIPQGISILTANFSRAQFPKAVSAFGPVMGMSAVLGPIAAGFIIDANILGLPWRPIFLINIVLGTIGFVASLKYLPHDRPTSDAPIEASLLSRGTFDPSARPGGTAGAGLGGSP